MQPEPKNRLLVASLRQARRSDIPRFGLSFFKNSVNLIGDAENCL
jgi:hypothetical protein